MAPLDWGLGHATRCIPIIKELLNQRCEVIVAASGAQKALLQREFPLLTFLEIPGYRIKFGKNRALTILRLLTDIPKILIRIKQENRWLRQLAGEMKLDLVLSDNRYGLFLPDIVSIFITHQLSIPTPLGAASDRLLQHLNYRYIRRYTCCWVPDTVRDGLAGRLSHPQHLPPIPTRYIGWLSRFSAGPEERITDFDLLVLLSGPEPQRSLLEDIIMKQAGGCSGKMVLIRGLPAGGRPLPALPANWQVHDHLPAAELEHLLRRSAVVLSRPGYSTVMDLVRLKRRAIFIPTPGQTEQGYLGVHLSKQGWAWCVQQHQLSLPAALAAARTHSFRLPAEEHEDLLKAAIADLL